MPCGKFSTKVNKELKKVCPPTKWGKKGLKGLKAKLRGTTEIRICEKTAAMKKIIGTEEFKNQDRFLIGKKCAEDETSIKTY